LKSSSNNTKVINLNTLLNNTNSDYLKQLNNSNVLASLQIVLNNDNCVYIGRKFLKLDGTFDSKWKNPFPAKLLGQQESIDAYKEYILSKPELIRDLHELKGKTLCCWCKPQKCHGDILVELINKYYS
jgi:hypothetical protein